ncbi:MAG TPA: hypothetical protein VD948_01515 [Rhodothermales bacterium]|nr:hypothetical protein [Rhodothermales bacterium]
MVRRALSAYTGRECIGDENAMDDMRKALEAAYGSVFEIAHGAAYLRGALRQARLRMYDAWGLLSPGMKAGTAEAKVKIEQAIREVDAALIKDEQGE